MGERCRWAGGRNLDLGERHSHVEGLDEQEPTRHLEMKSGGLGCAIVHVKSRYITFIIYLPSYTQTQNFTHLLISN